MLLYKQYINHKQDLNFIYYYVSNTSNPIIFCDNFFIISDLINRLPIFHSLYLNKIYNDHEIIVDNIHDAHILLTMGINNHSIKIYNHDTQKTSNYTEN